MYSCMRSHITLNLLARFWQTITSSSCHAEHSTYLIVQTVITFVHLESTYLEKLLILPISSQYVDSEAAQPSTLTGKNVQRLDIQKLKPGWLQRAFSQKPSSIIE